MKKRFSGDAVQAAFNERDWDVIALIVFRLLVDKSEFLAHESTEINDDGDEIKTRLVGPQLLQRAIETFDDEIAVLRAFSSAIALSNPVIRDYLVSEVKKSLKEAQSPTEQTGPQSSIASQANMAGPSRTSEPSRSAKFSSRSKKQKSGGTKS